MTVCPEFEEKPMDQSSALHAVAIYGRNGGSTRVRLFDWLDATGIPCVVHDYMGLGDVRPRSIVLHPARALASELQQARVARSSIDHIFLQREASPFSRGALEERLLKSAALGVYDFDDALQSDERAGLIGVLRNRHRKTIRCISAADRVIAGNEVLADFASSFSKDVVIIPSCVNQRRYTNKTSFELHDPPLLGWIGTPSGEKYVLGIATALLEMNRRTGARLQVVSGRKSSLGALEDIVDRFTWTEAISERIMSTWDMGIMPIEDRPFERGKCGYKLLQYAASSLPAIASPVGVNEEICQNLGFLPASSKDDWIEAFMTVVDAPTKVREEIGRKARDGVVRMFSFDAWKDRWLAAVGATLPRTSSS